VLAHELGHLARAHGRFRAWIYRLRTSWAQLPENLRKQGQRGWFIFAKFFIWYGPLFGAYTLVLARSQEYSADRHSAEAFGTTIAADALTAVAVGARVVTTEFWPSLLRTADTQPRPPSAPFNDVARKFREGLLADESESALKEILIQKSNPSDTHPPLRDRLAALGEAARLPGPIKKSAAEHFVGQSLVDLRGALNRQVARIVKEITGRRRDRAELTELFDCPTTIVEGVTEDEAEQIKRRIEKGGARPGQGLPLSDRVVRLPRTGARRGRLPETEARQEVAIADVRSGWFIERNLRPSNRHR
jgi:hypothetical protein